MSSHAIGSAASFMSGLSTLLQWRLDDLLDAAETARTDLVWSLYQHNRNPFVDHPERVEPMLLPPPTITLRPDTLTLLWSAPFPTGRVVATDTLGQAWTEPEQAPLRRGEATIVDLPRTSAARLFRLRLRESAPNAAKGNVRPVDVTARPRLEVQMLGRALKPQLTGK